MQSDQRFVICSIVTTIILALAAGIGTLSSTLGAPLGAIVLGEVSGFACVVAFTLLIWAAIQDGKHPEPAVAN
jgi:heme A synthase